MPVEIRPQPGPQTKFFESSADIVLFGGGAGGGKSWSILAEPLRHLQNGKFGAVILRRTLKQVKNEGGLWDEAADLYTQFGLAPNKSDLTFYHPNGFSVSFSHLETENDKYNYQGAQIALIEFDELTHFSASQFWYMVSRNRSVSGVRPYIRATCNPDADSWVAGLVEWWVDSNGDPIPERSGQIRYFVRLNNQLIWADTKEELTQQYPDLNPDTDILSFTFIHSSIHDNKILMDKDPGYMGKLKALDYVERARLLGGNWKVRATAGNVFRRPWFKVITPAHIPSGLRMVRYWDLAGTEAKEGKDPDWTVGTLMGVDDDGIYYVLDVVRIRGTALEVEKTIIETAHDDGPKVDIIITQEPGSAGKFVISSFVRHPELKGYTVRGDRETGSKVERAKPFSARCEAGLVLVLRAPWNEAWFSELQNFPEGAHDDQVDSASGGFRKLPRASRVKTKGEAA